MTPCSRNRKTKKKCSIDFFSPNSIFLFISEHLSSKAVEVWMGLNQLDENAGWQWSDRTPLNYLNWNPGTCSILTGGIIPQPETAVISHIYGRHIILKVVYKNV